ncbi:MAG: nucleotidyltransferase domain-containing protein [Clostridiales bacterium]|jgi:predicted nucleotidyltransferase|nr:nucleotidyltransferase domain-containing protein [Clostridiales bacterium]
MDKIVNENVTKYARNITSKFNPKAVYLYGSYAKGTARENSDIDVAVVFDKLDDGTYMSVFGNLFVLAADVDARIEPNLILDDGDVDKYSMLYEVQRTGVRIF